MRRVVLQQHDVGDQADPALDPFEQVVAEQGVLGDLPLQAALEGRHVVDPLAHEGPFPEQVLVHVRHRQGVQVEPRLAGEEAHERRLEGGLRLDLRARLEDGVAGRDLPAAGVERGPVQRVGQGADQLPGGARRQDGIRVQGDHVAERGQQGGVAEQDGFRKRLPAQEETVELVELAALALPAHPAAFPAVPHPPAVEEKEGLGGPVGVFRIESPDPFPRRVEQRLVLRHVRPGGVGEVGQQGEAEVGVRVAQVMELEVVQESGDVPGLGQQRRDHHDGAERVRDPFREIELRQDPGRGQADHPTVDQLDRDRDRRDQAQEKGAHRLRRIRPGGGCVPDGGRREEEGRNPDGAQVEGHGAGGLPARPDAQPCFQLRAAFAHQVMADVAPAPPVPPFRAAVLQRPAPPPARRRSARPSPPAGRGFRPRPGNGPGSGSPSGRTPRRGRAGGCSRRR